jgi:hypothetical protein
VPAGIGIPCTTSPPVFCSSAENHLIIDWPYALSQYTNCHFLATRLVRKGAMAFAFARASGVSRNV